MIASVDTLRNFTAEHAIPAGEDLLGRLPVHVPPGSYTVRVAVETESRGMVTPPRAVQVAALSAPTIELSDLALGARSVPLPWRTVSSDTAWLNPLHQFKSSEPMQLYFEVGGIAAGAGYRVQLAVIRAGRTDAQMQLGFSAVAAGTPDRFHREVEIGRLAAGNYVLQVTVSNPAGGKATRQRAFVVVK